MSAMTKNDLLSVKGAVETAAECLDLLQEAEQNVYNAIEALRAALAFIDTALAC